MIKLLFTKYKYIIISAILSILYIWYFSFDEYLELMLIVVPLVIVPMGILGIKGYFEGMNLFISLFVSVFVASHFNLNGYKSILAILIVFTITSTTITVISKIWYKEYPIKFEDFYNPYKTFFAMLGIAAGGIAYIILLSAFLIVLGGSYKLIKEKYFTNKLNGKFCAKVIVYDVPTSDEYIFTKRLNIEVKDNRLINYSFTEKLDWIDSTVLNEYNFINKEESNNDLFSGGDSVCSWLSKSQNEIIKLKIRYEGFCDN